MRHRDGSATFVPKEGEYIPSKRDANTNLPAPTMEDIIQEHEEIKKEHRQYLACPVNYWDGIRITPRTGRRRNDFSWLFQTYFLSSLWTTRLLTR